MERYGHSPAESRCRLRSIGKGAGPPKNTLCRDERHRFLAAARNPRRGELGVLFGRCRRRAGPVRRAPWAGGKAERHGNPFLVSTRKREHSGRTHWKPGRQGVWGGTESFEGALERIESIRSGTDSITSQAFGRLATAGGSHGARGFAAALSGGKRSVRHLCGRAGRRFDLGELTTAL